MSSPRHCRSTLPIDVLIQQAAARRERSLLAQTYSPLFPDESPFASLADVPADIARRDELRLNGIAQAVADYRDGLTHTARELTDYLGATEADIRELAMDYAKRDLPGFQKLAWAERILGSPVPGDSRASQLARTYDARFWRRSIRVILMREREHLFLRLHLIGSRAEAYVSQAQLKNRTRQLSHQAQWMKETVLIPRFLTPDALDKEAMTLESVCASPEQRFAKLYTFVKAMDVLANEHGLAAAMLTMTLEPEWHPNPSHGKSSWNGSSPRQAHASLGKRWQSVLRDLDRAGVGVSGLRVTEPHKDACPHWHIWLLYRPEHETTILETVIKYWPNKLKVRAPNRKGEDKRLADRIYDNLADLQAGLGRAPTHPKEVAQVEVSQIDRRISSGASYAMKYLLKTVSAGDQLNKEVGLLKDTTDPAERAEQLQKRKEHRATARRVDAYRSLWGINAGQLFGVAKCLTAWDELRRLEEAPLHPLLKKLWALARGSEKPGRIPGGASIRGNAKAFIETLGGLAACGKPPKDAVRLSIGRLVEQATNGYGETIARTKGVTLVERRRVKKAVGQRISRLTGVVTVKNAWRSVKTVVASVKTRLQEWMLIPKKHQKLAMEMAVKRLYADGYS